MKTKVLAAIEKYGMIQRGDTIASCLSGGADSMALFHFLCTHRDALGIKVIALHVNHGLRKESDDEEVFVKEYCRRMGAECIVKHLSMNDNVRPQGESTELWRRNLRYEFFFETAEKYGAKLATAHTLSDKTETMLFNAVRGTGLKGLSGIPAVRGDIIRPLIDCTRREIEEYCAENGIEYVTDKTNFDDVYSRNKIRLNVIPEFRKINPNFEHSMANLSEETQEIYTLLTHLSDNLYTESLEKGGLSVTKLLSADRAVTKNLIRNILSEKDCLSKDNVDYVYGALSRKSARHQLSRNTFCVVYDGHLTFEKPPVKAENAVTEITPEIPAEFLGRMYLLTYGENTARKGEFRIDASKTSGRLYMRNRRIGDEFTFKRRNVTKTVKKLFTEDKIPLSERDRIPILTDDTGKVIWLGGYGVNREYIPDADCSRVITLKTMSIEENTHA